MTSIVLRDTVPAKPAHRRPAHPGFGMVEAPARERLEIRLEGCDFNSPEARIIEALLALDPFEEDSFFVAFGALRAAAAGLPTPHPLSALMSGIDKDRQESLLSDFEALAIEYELTAWLDP